MIEYLPLEPGLFRVMAEAVVSIYSGEKPTLEAGALSALFNGAEKLKSKGQVITTESLITSTREILEKELEKGNGNKKIPASHSDGGNIVLITAARELRSL